MRQFRTFGNLFAIVVLIIGGYFALRAYGVIGNPCKYPRNYSIGVFDSRFGINEAKFMEEIKKAEAIWEGAAGKNIFEYKEDAPFTINLIFDERQIATIEEKRLRSKLESIQNSYEDITAEHKELVADYKEEALRYEEMLASYNRDVSLLNQKIAAFNKKGGAPRAVYEEIQREQELIRKRGEVLEAMRLSLNQKVEELNRLGKEGNTVARTYNSGVVTYKSKFGEPREFDQGDYTGKAINIYQFDNLDSLELVLAHELGHALTIGHVENPQSLMYYLMGEQDLDHIKLTKEDKAALQEACRLK